MASARHAMTRDGENGRIANKVLKSLQSKTLWVTLACTTPLGVGQNWDNTMTKLPMHADALIGAALTAVHGALSLDEPASRTPAACQSATRQ